MLRRILFAVLIPLTIFAQNDEKAEAILKAVSSTNSAYKDIQVSFSYTLNNKQADINDTRDGELTLSGNKFHLKLMGQDIYSDGKIVWYVMKDDQEVHVKSVDDFRSETDLDPANIFNQYDEGFKSKFHGEETVDGKTLNVVDLFPEDPSKKGYSRIRLGIDKKTNHIVYSKTFGKDGTDYILNVKSMKIDAGVPADQFVFSQAKYEAEDFDVVDFR
ncbi:MAG: outer membrane lipoprotein carrier protein LolA [Flavobacteriales bacterium]|nr:outer membrane lipoprotein carrier protein LolA [Flavobacteriales bacterium]